MVENNKEAAFPYDVEPFSYSFGLTKREYIAALVMQGIMANGGYSHNAPTSAAAGAVEHADALLKALKTKSK